MNQPSLLLAAILLLASPFVRAEAAGEMDLRYCLDLPSEREIAKCAGETRPGGKGETYTREQVEKTLAEEKTAAPASTSEPATPATPAGKP